MKHKLYQITKAALISVYLIFLAGSVVRMTGSGMGCPDWPKCFGYYIPPTEESQIIWQKNKRYEKGNIIVKDKKLWVAKKDFISKNIFNPELWEIYTKHNYAKFNVYHTWTEYVNRLTSVLSGFVFLFLMFYVLLFFRKNKRVLLLSSCAFLGMLLEAWMGKMVVDSVLKPQLITLHMVIGLLIIAALLNVLYLSSKKVRVFDLKRHQKFRAVLIISVLITLVQIALGTQVRQFVDQQVQVLGFENKAMSLYQPNVFFYLHRSLTILMVVINVWIYWVSRKLQTTLRLPFWILVLILVETLTGILMYYTQFPMGTQSVHLLFGAILFGLQYYLVLQSGSKKIIL